MIFKEDLKYWRLALEMAEENRILRKKIQRLRSELMLIQECCVEALTGIWGKEDSGFEAIRDGIKKVLKET